MSKIKACFYLTIISMLSIMLMISATASSTTVSAASPGSGGTGSSDTARKKEVWSIFSECLTNGWRQESQSALSLFGNKWATVGLTAKSLKEGKWFTYYIPSVQSPYTEKLVTGKYGDGKLKCDEENKVLSTATSTLGINQKDIICDPANNYQDNGMLTRFNSDSSCGYIYDSGGSEAGDTFLTALQNINKPYLNDIIAEVFNDEVPEGSVKELTSVEHYFVLYDSFMAICANGEGSKYTIQEVSGGKLVEKSYGGQYDRGGEYKYFYDKKDTCQGMADKLNEGKYGYVEAVQEYLNNGGAEDEKEAEDSKANSDEVEPNCQNQGGAGSLGWIVCSILDWMQRTTENMYEDVVEPALVVNKNYFDAKDNDNNNVVYEAWTTFRDFSNIIFIILILFVIFSQTTGVGIDNYGIKKILPKLIVAAVLVNLSYWICLICVDLSNILGAGFQDFFQDLAGRVPSASSITVNGDAVNLGPAINASVFAVGLVSVAVLAQAIYANAALLLTLFVSVLGVLAGVLFLFVLLAGRKAAIVLLTVFSPVAFVLYLLPNTKKLFDKWLKLWEGMLLVYPIAGVLIGGGNFASKLMLSVTGGGAATIFTAMIVGIIPIFFIPTVLKGAFSAMGTIGGMIAGAGSRVRSGTNKALKSNPVYKGIQDRGQERQKRLSGIRQERRKYRGAARRSGYTVDKKTGEIVQKNTPLANLKRKMSKKLPGMQASMGQDAADFAKMEATRRSNIYRATGGMEATFAGINEKEKAQRIADQETLMKTGRVVFNGKPLNTNSSNDMSNYHASLLRQAHEHQASGDTAAYNATMDKIKAAQNIMAKSDEGRGHIQENFEAVTQPDKNNKTYTGGLQEAANHLLDTQGANIKAVNRGMHALMQDLTTQDLSTQAGLNTVKQKIADDTYNKSGINSYTSQSIASADDLALDRLLGAVQKGSVNDTEMTQLNKIIDEARNNATIQLKGKTDEALGKIQGEINRRRATPIFNGGSTTSSGGSNP